MRRVLSIVLLLTLLVIPATAVAQRFIATHTTANVVGVDNTVLAANTNRNFLILQNDSAVNMYCSFNKSAVLHEGVLLLPNGVGVLFLDYKFAITSVHCIGSGQGPNYLLVTEGVQ